MEVQKMTRSDNGDDDDVRSHIVVVPPNIGTRALVLEIAWANLCPEGAFLAPPTIFHTVPPTKPTDRQTDSIKRLSHQLNI
jgi:hypothetical protein